MPLVEVNYTAEPTAAQFHASDALIRGLRGPIGTGKSVTCIHDIWTRAMRQKAVNGVRKSRCGAIRNTYPELKSTTIKSWLDWYGEITTMNWAAPITGTIKVPLPDGTRVEFEILFLAVDRLDDIKKLKSLDLTFCWLNEVSELAKAIFDMAAGRIARYPGVKDGGASHPCLVMDTNPPDDDHWYYKLAEEQDAEALRELAKVLKETANFDRPLMDFFALPPALIKVGIGDKARYMPNPEAEGVRYQTLGYAYWLTQVAGKSEEWIKVFLLGEYGTVSGGKPVYTEYRDSVHCATVRLQPLAGLPILLGWDFGHTPAMALAQFTPRGKLIVLDELCGKDVGIRDFARNTAKPYLLTHYRGFEFQSWADPAGTAGSQIKKEETCILELNEAGIPTKPARTNEFNARREGVAGFMNKMVDGQPGFLLSPKCKVLRKGFNGSYFYDRVPIIGEERFKDEPRKNIYSHIQDALQCIGLQVDQDIRRELKSARVRNRRGNAKRGYEPADSVGGY